MILSEAIGAFQRRYAARLKPSRQAKYQSYFNWLAPLHAADISKLSANDLGAVFDQRSHLSYLTLENARVSLGCFWRWCLRMGYGCHNPLPDRPFKPDRSRGEQDRRYVDRYIDPATVLKVVQQIRALKHRLIILMTATTGMRIGEVLGIKVDNIDLDEQLIQLPDSKTGSPRIVVIDSSTKQLISYWLERLLMTNRLDGYLFPADFGAGHVSYNCIHKIWRRACDQALASNSNGKPITLHQLRASYITDSVATTAVPLIMRQVGHESVKTTELYIDKRKVVIDNRETIANSARTRSETLHGRLYAV